MGGGGREEREKWGREWRKVKVEEWKKVKGKSNHSPWNVIIPYIRAGVSV